MKTLDVPRLKTGSPEPSIQEISEMMDSIAGWHRVDTINWAEFSYRPEVSFAIAHSGTEIFIKFFVTEEYFRAECMNSNDNVYEDSCVEFFVSPAGDGIYYNFEFNALGTCLMGSGTGRADSSRVDPNIISMIRRLGSLPVKPVPASEGLVSWTLTVAIPSKCFFRHGISDLSGQSFRANFYKCGDKLKLPHYLSWSDVETKAPDFHRPEFFGQIHFLK